MQNIFFFIYFNSLTNEILGHVKVFRKLPDFNHSCGKHVYKILLGHKPADCPAIRALLLFFSYIERRIYVIERTCFAMTQLMGKMHPLLSCCINSKRVNSYIAGPHARYRRYRNRLRQIATDNFRTALPGNFIKFSCFRFLPPPLLQCILRN